jgi:hypothetical protein
MLKMTVIKSKTVEDAKVIFGEDRVNLVFERIQRKSPGIVLEELEDEEAKKCLIFLLGEITK